MTPLGERLAGDLRLGLLVLFGAVAFILLIACANVANLLLSRARARQKELAIRAALGAGRGRLIRQMLTESLLLSVLGGAAGFLLAMLGNKALIPLIPDDLAHLKNIGVDATALGFTFLAALLTGVVVGVIPALQASKIDLNENLKKARAPSHAQRRAARFAGPGDRRIGVDAGAACRRRIADQEFHASASSRAGLQPRERADNEDTDLHCEIYSCAKEALLPGPAHARQRPARCEGCCDRASSTRNEGDQRPYE